MILKVKEGWEGPRFDPYSYVEKTVENEVLNVVFHQGAINYVRVENKEGEVIEFHDDKEFKELNEIFEKITGLNDRNFDRAYSRINFPTKCPECGSKKMTWQGGYPGEQIRFCKCGHITGYIFNENDVM